MGLWHWFVQVIGKKKAWQAYSLISIVTYSLFLFCDEGMMILFVVLSVINSFPAGAGYLTDVFVSDSIDYDEFIAGFTDYTHISTLRKDLIIRDYEVVDVFTFFEEIVDEIPQLSKNEYRNWRLFSLDNTDFLVVNQFDNQVGNS